MSTLVKSLGPTACAGLLALATFQAAAADEKPPAPRDPLPIAAAVDRELDRRLADAKVPASPAADDAEFCRRLYLDLVGRIPSAEQATAFLDSKDPEKRQKLIDELLASTEYGRHFGIVWSDLVVKRDENNRTLRPQRFKEWLAEQFNKGRGWDAVVTELLTAEGNPDSSPPALFFLANRDMTRVAPSKVVGTASALFMGMQLQCAECHNHAFVRQWKQTDFWGMAAFFAQTRAEGGQGQNPAQGTITISEAASRAAAGRPALGRRDAGPAPPTGASIRIPDATDPRRTVGTVNAKYFLGEEPKLPDKPPYRQDFAKWLTSTDNPYFAQATANRWWAHFFARGFINPIEDFNPDNPPSNPEALKLLAEEFKASGHDLKHLVRCICNTKAYQRTSQPVQGNGDDTLLFSHPAVKVMNPEVLYDSLCRALGTDELRMGGGTPSRFGARGPAASGRERFVSLFTTREDGDEATEFGLGVPQFLRLMNSAQFNEGGPVIDRLLTDDAKPEQVIEGLYLATLSRRPTPDEVKKLTAYVAKKGDAKAGYVGVLWVLLNSAEFICIR